MPRKTIKIEALTEKVNTFLAAPVPAGLPDERSKYMRLGAIALLEGVLFSSDNYHGFQFLPSEFEDSGNQHNDHVLREDYDTTRRRYF